MSTEQVFVPSHAETASLVTKLDNIQHIISLSFTILNLLAV